MNTQPLRVVLVATPEAKERLLPHLAEGNRAKAASAPLVAILAADTDFHEHLPRLLPHAPGAKDRFADDERREQAARFNATLQAGYFILAVRAVGLDAGPMGGFDAAGIDRDLLGDGAAEVLPRRQHRPCRAGRHLPAQPAARARRGVPEPVTRRPIDRPTGTLPR